MTRYARHVAAPVWVAETALACGARAMVQTELLVQCKLRLVRAKLSSDLMPQSAGEVRTLFGFSRVLSPRVGCFFEVR